MEGCFWKILLVVVALSASGHGAPSWKPLPFEEAVEQGVTMYNTIAEEDSLYRLLEAVPQPEWDPNSEGTQELKFIIKETVCPAGEELSLEKCDFKQDGVVRECTIDYFIRTNPPVGVFDCDVLEVVEEVEEDQPERFKKIKKTFKKIKRKMGKELTKRGFWILFQQYVKARKSS